MEERDMTDQQWLAERFEEDRPRLRAVAYRMLGSLTEADDAVQDAWLRVSRADTSEVDNLGAFLTTIVARVALNMLRARATRRQQPLDDVHLPDPVIDHVNGTDPEHEALLADSVGLALLVVLETLSPAERLAFVLHDMFAVPFDQVAAIVDRTPEATRQLASRARRRVRGTAPVPDADLDTQWRIVDAFLAAARDGDFEALVAVLDPDVVLRADGGMSGLSHRVQGAAAVAGQATMFGQAGARAGLIVRRALVNGAAGLVSERHGKPFSVGAFTIRNGKIVELDFLVDPERLARLDLEVLQG
jgi:RNA polymerase sigma-70 factor (ECF subfamily)